MTAFWREAPDGLVVMLKVQPRSRRPGLQGTVPAADGERLRIGVSEPAEGGRANRAACAALAAALGVPGSAVTVVAGATSREKRVHVTGEPAALAARLAAL